ncbi:MAG: hypothetical protein KA110_02570 [Acidimicrobiia bacterium]|nr:hypothetical protein [Acidimicrobiia bacterium]
MGMREDCRYYESRTYATGDVVRKCRLDLAPEAPWRCPDDCPSFVRRTYDAGWNYGSLAPTPSPSEPQSLEVSDDDIAALLDSAEDIVNSEVQALAQELQKKPGRSFFGRRKKGQARPDGKGKKKKR